MRSPGLVDLSTISNGSTPFCKYSTKNCVLVQTGNIVNTCCVDVNQAFRSL